MRLEIRIGRASDASALAALAARTFFETFAADNRPEDMELHIASSYGDAQQGSELADKNITTLLAEVDGELIGYAQLKVGASPSCVTGDNPIELMRFYLAKEWHGKGIAMTLMNRVTTEAVSRGARTLWLGVWERNERAKAYYRKAGFVDVGSHVFVVGSDAQTDRIMMRGLPARE